MRTRTSSSLARIGFRSRIISNRATPKYLTASSLFFRPRSSALAKFPGSQLRWKGFPVFAVAIVKRRRNEQLHRGFTRLTDSRYLQKSRGGVGGLEGTFAIL